MSDIELNPLNANLRKLLQYGVALILVLFLVVYFLLFNKGQQKIKNNTVYLQDSKLYVFDETIELNQYPDKLAFHSPYLIIIKPNQKLSYIYNLELKKKEKDVKEIVLDYYKNDILSNQGKSTFFNKEDLGILCEKGFIKNSQEILCVTKVNTNFVQNKLVSIDIKTKNQKDLYVSNNLITDVSVINNRVYYGEVDLYSRKNYLIAGTNRIEVPDVISLIYQMDNTPYFASFKSALNGQKESYYILNNNQVIKLLKDRISLY